MTIFAAIAEFECDLLRERTDTGCEAAKKRGVQFGRPRKLALDQVNCTASCFGGKVRPGKLRWKLTW